MPNVDFAGDAGGGRCAILRAFPGRARAIMRAVISRGWRVEQREASRRRV